ncbi:hypothetical protein HAX54_025289 [Datura stramonium]|uniref:Uncharacterized protein n=1 Tax=Datura stramonium TaxID=4076 RepID=A0ABS8S643_DATST|nr:hypothetical protein [Datura stramonium]
MGSSPEAVRNWAIEAWRVADGLKITQLGNTKFFRFAEVSQTSSVLLGGKRWLDDIASDRRRWEVGGKERKMRWVGDYAEKDE